MMLFINPVGGKKKGVKIWEKDVQPLMTIAGIETKMIITERAGHIRDVLLTADLSDLHVSFVLIRPIFCFFRAIYIHTYPSANKFIHVCIMCIKSDLVYTYTSYTYISKFKIIIN